MKSKNVEKVFTIFADKTVALARTILDKKGKNVSGKTKDSLGYFLNVDRGTVDLKFLGAPHTNIVDKGIRGSKSAAKAPRSPFKFTGSKKAVNLGAIDKWVVRKGLDGVRDEKGRFIPRKTMVFLVARKIYLFGIEPTNFFTDALSQTIKGLPKQIARAYAKDATQFIQNVTKEL
ncbi:MAG: hypothetical protein GOVbin568_16 [Prokaryotic dsDNA virus sp.]|nr:MAG: hypothetical protein GOVbin568_16 [Prokaryotic dsDNA virus sp.]|tara:strand:+ start:15609 stop:16133 length:525 start_codon:yes stop_codon:yes gene_type:complete